MANSEYVVVENGKEVFKAQGMMEFLFSCGEKSSEGRVKLVPYDKNYFLKAYSYLNNTPKNKAGDTDDTNDTDDIDNDTNEVELTPAEKHFDEVFTYEIHNLIEGKKFVNSVQQGFYISSDGTVSNIFVNGMRSNLGFYHNEYGHFGGGFLVDDKTFEKMCDVFDIEVNWAHK